MGEKPSTEETVNLGQSEYSRAASDWHLRRNEPSRVVLPGARSGSVFPLVRRPEPLPSLNAAAFLARFPLPTSEAEPLLKRH